jgi:Mannosyltransferase putative
VRDPALRRVMRGFVSRPLLSRAVGQVLLLDCDSAPLLNPAPLFETAAFREKGSLYWPDYPTDDGAHVENLLRPEAYGLHGLLPPWLVSPTVTFHQTETGQSLFNRCARATREKEKMAETTTPMEA